MYKISRKIIFVMFFIAFLVMNVSAITPTVEIEPEKPAPESEVTFTADFSETGIADVYLIYNECESSDLCHSLKNVSMDLVSGSTYEKQITLEWPKATYIQYRFDVLTDDGWISDSDMAKVDLSTQDSSDNTGSNDTPGFEIVVLLFSIAIIAFIVKRKR